MVFQQTFSALLIASVSFAFAPSFAHAQNAAPIRHGAGHSQSVQSGAVVSAKSLGTRDGIVWVPKADMPVAVAECYGGVIDGKFYVVGDGYTAVYDPELDAWDDALALMPTDRMGYGAACAVDGKLYVLGGMGMMDPFSDINEMYDPVTNAWSTMQPMPTPLDSGTVAVADGKIYRIDYAATEVYDPALDDGLGGQNAWTAMETAPSDLGSLFDAAVVDGKIYIFGGNFATSVVYDPAKDDGPGGESAWSPVAAIPMSRNQLRAVALHGKIHVLAGSPLTGGTTDIHNIYDPETDTWSEGAPNLVSRFSFAAGVIDNSIYMAGGSYFSTGAVATKSLEQYTETIPEPSAIKNWTLY